MGTCRLKGQSRNKQLDTSVLVQEDSGIHMGISPDLATTARHAADLFNLRYQQWLERDRFRAWGRYKRHHFTVAVGGGNTLKAKYKAWLDHHYNDINWIQHVRFFFLEESSGEKKWESAETGLVMNFIVPLAQKLIRARGSRRVAEDLKLDPNTDDDEIIDQMIASMIHPINLVQVKQALDSRNKALATRLARQEAERYQREIQSKLGADMAFHFVASGIGKDGTIGAFSPYTPQLAITEPGAVVLKQRKGALRVAINRGALINAECISLIVSGNRKLRALGRFEMEDVADFEQTVMETPLRMLRQTYEIAAKVYIFADEQALHFDYTVFEYRESGVTMQNKAERREGEEKGGIHMLLMHGFMGLFSFTSFLIRLPSAWTVSALHRGSHAKTLPNDDIFPHYANSLRKKMLKNWRRGRPVPIVAHSVAGVIVDHLLLSIIGDYDGPIPAYGDLSAENKQLVDALRVSGIIALATWAPTDGPHIGENIKNLISHLRHGTELDYSGVEVTYNRDAAGSLEVADPQRLAESSQLELFDQILHIKGVEPWVNSVNRGMRRLLNNKTVQQRMLKSNIPYALRLVAGRLLKTASFYGLAKEVNAAFHHTVEYQRRHLKSLDILLAYDIPFVSIIHEDDFFVSAGRHREEHDFLVERRLEKEGVSREEDLDVTARLIVLQREAETLPVDPLNPHLLVVSTSSDGNRLVREITATMTQFVNENVARAMQRGQVRSLASVRKWLREHAG